MSKQSVRIRIIITSIYYIEDKSWITDDKISDGLINQEDYEKFKLKYEIEDFEEGETKYFNLTIFDCSNQEYIIEGADVDY